MENINEITQLIEHLEKHDLAQAPSEKWQDRQSGILRVRATFGNGQSFTVDIADKDTIAKVNMLFQENLKRVFARTSEFRELLNLENGKKYTVIIESEMGLGVHAIPLTLEFIKVGRYAQYDNCIELVFKPKGGRKLRSLQFYGRNSFAVFVGWIDVDTDPFGPEDHSGILVSRRSKYLSCDERYMIDAVESAKVAPLCSKIFPTFRSEGGAQ